MTGAHSIEEATEVKRSLNTLLKKRCMHLMKWISNSSAVLATVPKELQEADPTLSISSPEECAKAIDVH